MSKKVFVTGATGFIGHHLCNKLYEEGYRVFASGRKDENKIKCHEFHTCSLRNIPWDDLPKIDICFHLAANNDVRSKKEFDIMDINYHTSINVFKNLSERGCSRFVYSSCCFVYGDQPGSLNEDATPLNGSGYYSKSKISFEKFVKDFSFRTKSVCVGLRYASVYGTHELHKKSFASAISQIVQKIQKNERPKIFGDSNQEKDWVYINDVIDANILASKYDYTDIFNIASGNKVSLNKVVSIVNKRFNKNIIPEYLDNKFNEPTQNSSSISMEKSRSKLRYSPNYTVEDGVQDMKMKLT